MNKHIVRKLLMTGILCAGLVWGFSGKNNVVYAEMAGDVNKNETIDIEDAQLAITYADGFNRFFRQIRENDQCYRIEDTMHYEE